MNQLRLAVVLAILGATLSAQKKDIAFDWAPKQGDRVRVSASSTLACALEYETAKGQAKLEKVRFESQLKFVDVVEEDGRAGEALRGRRRYLDHRRKRERTPLDAEQQGVTFDYRLTRARTECSERRPQIVSRQANDCELQRADTLGFLLTLSTTRLDVGSSFSPDVTGFCSLLLGVDVPINCGDIRLISIADKYAKSIALFGDVEVTWKDTALGFPMSWKADLSLSFDCRISDGRIESCSLHGQATGDGEIGGRLARVQALLLGSAKADYDVNVESDFKKMVPVREVERVLPELELRLMLPSDWHRRRDAKHGVGFARPAGDDQLDEVYLLRSDGPESEKNDRQSLERAQALLSGLGEKPKALRYKFGKGFGIVRDTADRALIMDAVPQDGHLLRISYLGGSGRLSALTKLQESLRQTLQPID